MASEKVPAASTMGSWRSNRSLLHLASVIAQRLSLASRVCDTAAACPAWWRGNTTDWEKGWRPRDVHGEGGWPWAESSSLRTGTGTHAVLVGEPTSAYAGFHASLSSPFTVCAGQPLTTAHQRWFVSRRTQECGDLEVAGEIFFFFFFCLIQELCGLQQLDSSIFMFFGDKLGLENKSLAARGPCTPAAEGESPFLHAG